MDFPPSVERYVIRNVLTRHTTQLLGFQSSVENSNFTTIPTVSQHCLLSIFLWPDIKLTKKCISWLKLNEIFQFNILPAFLSLEYRIYVLVGYCCINMNISWHDDFLSSNQTLILCFKHELRNWEDSEGWLYKSWASQANSVYKIHRLSLSCAISGLCNYKVQCFLQNIRGHMGRHGNRTAANNIL